jgi:UDP-N-acetylmuramate--alanine ligase
LWREFGSAFKEAEGIWVTEIFAASEQPMEGVSGELIAKAISECEPNKLVRFESNWDAIVDELLTLVKPQRRRVSGWGRRHLQNRSKIIDGIV